MLAALILTRRRRWRPVEGHLPTYGSEQSKTIKAVRAKVLVKLELAPGQELVGGDKTFISSPLGTLSCAPCSRVPCASHPKGPLGTQDHSG